MKHEQNTHERFISSVRDIVARHVDTATRDKLLGVKLVYGRGNGTYRGICHYEAWANGQGKTDFLEIAASGEEHPIQLAGTTIHELAHTLTRGDGHGKLWREACATLGLNNVSVGCAYYLAMFAPSIRAEIARLSILADGSPVFGSARSYGVRISTTVKPCPMGIGTRGGKSRGIGSGSRLRLYQCACEKPVKVRVASDEFLAHCDTCGESFKRVETCAQKRKAA